MPAVAGRWKSLLALLLLVVVPIILIASLSFRMAANERNVVATQFRALANSQLQSIDGTLQGLLNVRAEQLIEASQTLNLSSASLRSWLRGQPEIAQILVMDPEGKRTHPPVSSPMNQEEVRFVERMTAVLEDRDILYRARARQESSPGQNWSGKPEIATRRPTRTDPKVGFSPVSGWYAWHWGTDIRLLFWVTKGTDLVVFELEPARLMADMIGILPDAAQAEASLGRAAIQLLDSNGAAIYAWGAQISEDRSPIAMLALSQPLASWRLQYFDTLNLATNRLPWNLMLSGLATLLATVVLAAFLYREHGRELRDAGQKVNFVNQVSHELKTPLTNIRLYAEMLEDKIDGPSDTEKRYLDVIVSESQRLSRLIGNVLTFSKSSQQEIQPRLSLARIDHVVKQCVEAMLPSLSARNIEVTIDGSASSVVMTDADLVEQVVINLLSNVEKYAPNAPLKITLSQTLAEIRLDFHDGGPGIPSAEREQVFHPFHRIDGSLSEGASGTGIGLGIARDLARALGGDLSLLPTKTGACFQVVLPNHSNDRDNA